MVVNRVDPRVLTVDEDLVLYYGAEPFTGVAEVTWPDGGLKLEQFYCRGLAHGWKRKWSVDGRLLEEGLFLEGVLRKRRQYYDNGLVGSELFQSDVGVVFRRRSWNEAGEIEEDFYLDGFEDLFWDSNLPG